MCPIGHAAAIAQVDDRATLSGRRKPARSARGEINVTDEQIDALVYELYGLTAEEIRIVDGR